jgi:hypothetical protein
VKRSTTTWTGEGGEHAEDHLARWAGGVDGGTFTREHLGADFALREVMDQVDKVAELAAQPVELPDDQRIGWTQGL